MTKQELLRYADHTLLAPTATEAEIKVICDDAMKYETASVCIPATYIAFARDYTEGKLNLCTVIGFPLGYSTTAVKCAEARDAIANGAGEIDMVANICNIKNVLLYVYVVFATSLPATLLLRKILHPRQPMFPEIK